MENDIIAAISPTTPHITACLAAATLVGSPWEVTNINAAIRNITAVAAARIGHIILNAPCTTCSKVYPLPGGGGVTYAKVRIGNTNKIDIDETINFLFILFGCWVLSFGCWFAVLRLPNT